MVIKNKAVIGIVENVEFLGYKYKFLSSISQVGTEFKSYKDVCKIENKKIVKVNYESPSVLCKYLLTCVVNYYILSQRLLRINHYIIDLNHIHN